MLIIESKILYTVCVCTDLDRLSELKDSTKEVDFLDYLDDFESLDVAKGAAIGAISCNDDIEYACVIKDSVTVKSLDGKISKDVKNSEVIFEIVAKEDSTAEKEDASKLYS